MRVDLFDFDLPPERIALRPIVPRDAARMLIVRPSSAEEKFEDRRISDLPDVLRPGDVLIVNDTEVIPARLLGHRRRGATQAKIEVLLHKRVAAAQWLALAKGAKKLQLGETILFAHDGARLEAEVLDKGEEGEVLLRFAVAGEKLDAVIDALGQMPLPPYIAAKRPPDARDVNDYQSLFARRRGAVAAPTASLHFTPELVAALCARDIEIVRVTLHVGPGTFLPVKVEETQAHRMHAEWGEIGASAAARINEARAEGRRIVAVGTTALRLIESAARQDGTIAGFCGETALFIAPGYRFNAIDVLLTNFHLPRSTLFMLVAAFSGLETMKAAYRHAIGAKFRFYSYGDACLLFPED
ncbi:MAG: tRNA preQ1(34) S-adenosylmethionine ribosyltransferase-isomerase QueA [Methylovirgula sp.]